MDPGKVVERTIEAGSLETIISYECVADFLVNNPHIQKGFEFAFMDIWHRWQWHVTDVDATPTKPRITLRARYAYEYGLRYVLRNFLKGGVVGFFHGIEYFIEKLTGTYSREKILVIPEKHPFTPLRAPYQLESLYIFPANAFASYELLAQLYDEFMQQSLSDRIKILNQHGAFYELDGPNGVLQKHDEFGVLKFSALAVEFARHLGVDVEPFALNADHEFVAEGRAYRTITSMRGVSFETPWMNELLERVLYVALPVHKRLEPVSS